MADEPIWEGDIMSLRVRVYGDGRTEYKGATEWHETRESLLDKHVVEIVVACVAAREKQRAKNEALQTFCSELEWLYAVKSDRLAKLETATRVAMSVLVADNGVDSECACATCNSYRILQDALKGAADGEAKAK